MPEFANALLASAAVAASTAFAAGPLARRWLARHSAVHANRAALWQLFYGLDWGDVTTNNYGFAPTSLDGPERHQHQMYEELLLRAERSGRLCSRTRLLEVSCGRGGGLAHLVRRWPGELDAIGLDLSENAVEACRRRFGRSAGLSFMRGSALDLPFPDGSFDVVVNVEASNDYGDHAAFYREVCRVLRPAGLFLYCDSRRSDLAERLEAAMWATGLEGELEDVTERVLEACRADASRRAALIREKAPFVVRRLFDARLRSYAALPGSRKFQAFESGRRRYLMTCARKPAAARPIEADVVARW